MQITEAQAKIIASALIKPITDGYAESQFGIFNGDQGVVGITRKFRSCYIFVEFNGKKDKSVKLHKMPLPLQLEVVMDRVIEALNRAKTMQDKELDTEKPNFHPNKIGSFLKNRPDYKEADTRIDDSFNESIEEIDAHDVESLAQDIENLLESQNIVDEITEKSMPIYVAESDDIEYTATPEPEQQGHENEYKGFDIYSYVTTDFLSNSVIDRIHKISVRISNWSSEKTSNESRKDLFVCFLDALTQALLFSTMTPEETVFRSNTLTMSDLYDFVLNKDLAEIDDFFSKLPSSHMAFSPYKTFASEEMDTKEIVIQNIIFTLSNYRTEDFNNMFDNLDEEIINNEENDVELMEESEEYINPNNDVYNHNLENNGEPNAYYVMNDTSVETSIGKARNVSQLQHQICNRANDFAKGMGNVFSTIAEKEPEQAENLYLVSIAIALKIMNGDASVLAEKINSDARDIIMADYEYQLRKKEHKAV